MQARTRASIRSFGSIVKKLYIVQQKRACYDYPMALLFGSVHPKEAISSMSEAQALVDSFRVRRQTGVLRLAYSPSETLYLFFKRGAVITSFLSDSEQVQGLAHDKWREKIQTAGDAYAKSIPLSSFGLLLAGLSLQMQNGHSEAMANPGDVTNFFKSRTRVVEPSLFQIKWRSSAGIVFFPDGRVSPHSIYVSNDSVVDESGISRAFHEWEDPTCEASVYFPDASMDLWQEYRLHRLFVDICMPVLSHFERLTGRALMDSLVRLMMMYTSNHDLDISISTRQVVNREVFFSSEVAAHKYQSYLSEMFRHCSAVLGPRLLASLLRDVVAELPEADRDLVKKYALLPRGLFHD
jgi:hypothetical protein